MGGLVLRLRPWRKLSLWLRLRAYSRAERLCWTDAMVRSRGQTMRPSSLIALIAFMASGVRAAPAADGSPHALALAAGYKAAFLCSGLFDAGEPQDEVAADDLEGVYPQYQSAVRTLTARVDSAAKTVSVAFDAHLPPRIAALRPWLGCAQLPV